MIKQVHVNLILFPFISQDTTKENEKVPIMVIRTVCLDKKKFENYNMTIFTLLHVIFNRSIG